MSLKVSVVQPKVGVAENSSFLYHPKQPVRQMRRFSGEAQTAVIAGLGTVMRMKAKDDIQARQPAGTGQREGRELPAPQAGPGQPCPTSRAAARSAAARQRQMGACPFLTTQMGNQERNRGYRANSMRKAGAQPVSSQKSHIIHQPVREAIRLKFALAFGAIADRETEETCPPAFSTADP